MRVPVLRLPGLPGPSSLGVAPLGAGASGLRFTLRVPLSSAASDPGFEAALVSLARDPAGLVHLRGRASFPAPAEVHRCAVTVGSASARFFLVADRPVIALPLTAAYARDAAGRPFDPEADGLPLGLSNPPAPGDGVVADVGARVEALLPPLPALHVEGRHRARERLEPVYAGLEIDLSAARPALTAVARALLPRVDRSWLRRVILAPAGLDPDLLLARAEVRLLAEPSALHEDPRTDLERAVVEAAALDLLAAPAPAPALDRDRFAAAFVALGRGGDRAAVLAAHGLDERTWLLEERAWLEGLAAEARAGDARGALGLGQATAAAAASRPFTLDEYAALRAAVDASVQPELEVARRGVALAEWIGVDLRMRDRARREPPFAAELDAALARARAARREVAS